MSKNTFSIFQLKDGDKTWAYRFEPFDRLQRAELSVNRESYDLIYTAPLAESDTLGAIFTRFNIDQPDDFAGHSLSISDVVAFHKDGKDTAYYVDTSSGFVSLEGFLRPGELENPVPEVYKYYSTQRPVDIGTFPKTEGGPARIVNFDGRNAVEHGRFRAWGYLLYRAPLTEKQMGDYELRAAPGNPDRKRLEELVQTVGRWEEKHKLPESQRFTWWHPDFGVFVKNDQIPDAKLIGRYEKIMGMARTEKKPIAERLKEAAKQAERDAAPPVQKKSHDHEER